MDNVGQSQTVSDQQLAAAVDNVPAQADGYRGERLAVTQKLSAARSASLAREHTRVQAKFGSDSPRARQLAQRVILQGTVASVAGSEYARSQITLPTAPKGDSIIFGRVVTKAGGGVDAMTVSAQDANANVLTYACTDATGAFSLTLGSATGGVTTQPPAGAETKAQAPLSVLLRVTDQEQQVRYEDTTAMTLSPDKSYYRELVIGDPKTQCVPPPSTSGKRAKGSLRNRLPRRGE